MVVVLTNDPAESIASIYHLYFNNIKRDAYTLKPFSWLYVQRQPDLRTEYFWLLPWHSRRGNGHYLHLNFQHFPQSLTENRPRIRLDISLVGSLVTWEALL